MRAAADAVVHAWMIQDLQMLGSSEGQQVLRFAVAVVRDRSLPEKNHLSFPEVCDQDAGDPIHLFERCACRRLSIPVLRATDSSGPPRPRIASPRPGSDHQNRNWS